MQLALLSYEAIVGFFEYGGRQLILMAVIPETMALE